MKFLKKKKTTIPAASTQIEKPRGRFEMLEKLDIKHRMDMGIGYIHFTGGEKYPYKVDADELELALRKAFEAGQKMSDATGEFYGKFKEVKPVTKDDVLSALSAQEEILKHHKIVSDTIDRINESGLSL